MNDRFSCKTIFLALALSFWLPSLVWAAPVKNVIVLMTDGTGTSTDVPVPPEVLEVLQAFVAENYQPEPKRRKRPDSFQPLQDRFGNPASVSTEKHRGGGGRG